MKYSWYLSSETVKQTIEAKMAARARTLQRFEHEPAADSVIIPVLFNQPAEPSPVAKPVALLAA
jgi:hypothetical protein